MSFFADKTAEKAENVAPGVVHAFLPIPAFADLGKSANDLVNKDFYHLSQATLDVKLKAPNGTAINVKGKQGFDGVTSGSVEGKHTIKPQGTANSSLSPPSAIAPKKVAKKKDTGFINLFYAIMRLPAPLRDFYFHVISVPYGHNKFVLTYRHSKGVTVTQSWTTGSLLDSKVELADVLAPGVKAEVQNLFNPAKPDALAQKLNLAFKNPNVHSRAFLNYAHSKGAIDAVVDVVAGHEGFLLGGEAGYDVQKAAVTKYSLGLGYQTPTFNATIVGTQNLSVIAASFYQKVNSSVEVGAKGGYDVQAQKASGLELASKYKLDQLSFAKAKINDRGIAAFAYSTKLNAGTTLGLGLSLDTNKLNEAGHKVGTSLTFEG